MSLPAITLTGNAVADAELRFTASGVAVATVRVACSSRKKVGDEWVDGDSCFLDVKAWKQLAENVAESVTKGTTVTVVGELKQRSYETNSGEKRTVYEVTARSVAIDLGRQIAQPNKASRSGSQTDARKLDDPWSSGPVGGVEDAPF